MLRIVFGDRVKMRTYSGRVVAGSGGASRAFLYADRRRIKEYAEILGFEPFPGSLNVVLDTVFDWSDPDVIAETLDVIDRSAGFDSEWALRPIRFYRVRVDGHEAVAYRHVGEKYPRNFLELIAPVWLRGDLTSERVTVTRV